MDVRFSVIHAARRALPGGAAFHISWNPSGETKKWYDKVVAATAYIGPLPAP